MIVQNIIYIGFHGHIIRSEHPDNPCQFFPCTPFYPARGVRQAVLRTQENTFVFVTAIFPFIMSCVCFGLPNDNLCRPCDLGFRLHFRWRSFRWRSRWRLFRNQPRRCINPTDQVANHILVNRLIASMFLCHSLYADCRTYFIHQGGHSAFAEESPVRAKQR